MVTVEPEMALMSSITAAYAICQVVLFDGPHSLAILTIMYLSIGVHVAAGATQEFATTSFRVASVVSPLVPVPEVVDAAVTMGTSE
jgi:hypothetical protein